jgi:hypothetical protein
MTVGSSFTERRDAESVDKRCHSPTVGTRESVAAAHLAAWRHRRGKGPRARRWNGRPAALEEQDRSQWDRERIWLRAKWLGGLPAGTCSLGSMRRRALLPGTALRPLTEGPARKRSPTSIPSQTPPALPAAPLPAAPIPPAPAPPAPPPTGRATSTHVVGHSFAADCPRSS